VREAHQNDESNANSTLIYSNTHDDPKAYTHVPSEARRRTCTIPTPGRHHWGTGAQRATRSGPGLQWPMTSIPDYPSTGRGPLPVSAGSRKVTKTSQISGFSQNEYHGTDPKIFPFSRIEFRWDFIPDRDQISIRLTLGLRKLPQASRSLQRARIWEDACLPRLCQTPPGGPIGCSSPRAPPEGSFHLWLSGSLDTHPRGVSHATSLGGCYVGGHDPSRAHAGGPCHP